MKSSSAVKSPPAGSAGFGPPQFGTGAARGTGVAVALLFVVAAGIGLWALASPSPFGGSADEELVAGLVALAATVAFAVLIWMVRRPLPGPAAASMNPAVGLRFGAAAPVALRPTTMLPAPHIGSLPAPVPAVLATELAYRAGARLSNLATPLVGLTEMALSSLDLDHPSRSDVEAIGRCGLQVSLIAQMLEVFGGVRHLRIESVPLETVWTAAENELRLLLRANTILHVDRVNTAARVRVDLELTRMILLLLARNAEDAMAPGGTVHVRLEGDTVQIRDTGAGISEQARATLYRPLTSGRGPEDGIGLGLHVARLAALTQTADLFLESTGPGGTVFSIRFARETGSAGAPQTS